eukprot:scaffold2135_cov271-Chaetoceros_neogracile.AAC.8
MRNETSSNKLSNKDGQVRCDGESERKELEAEGRRQAIWKELEMKLCNFMLRFSMVTKKGRNIEREEYRGTWIMLPMEIEKEKPNQ